MLAAVRRAHVIRHVAFEDLGSLAPALGRHGYRIQLADAGVDRLDAAAAADLLIVLGGPIGANDDDRYPWLAGEAALIRQRLDESRATLGICLGAQLMARALGAAVYPARRREIGYAPLMLTTDGQNSVLRHIDGALAQVLHWHGDTFDLPPGCQWLASTPDCPHQAFAAGARGLALQFHAEAEAASLERWLIGHAVELGLARIEPAELREQARRHCAALERQASLLWDEWLGALYR
jgi:GMP synthase (glutamine-hydrolysing)